VIRFTHEAQVMPSTGRDTIWIGPGWFAMVVWLVIGRSS
jgi:hypothetical protein